MYPTYYYVLNVIASIQQMAMTKTWLYDSKHLSVHDRRFGFHDI